MFLNRDKELATLNKEYNSAAAAFTVVYGRRRVGKTALISHFIKEWPHLYFYATRGSIHMQLQSFTKELRKKSNVSYAENLQFDSFEDALLFLAQMQHEKRFVLVIDEYQNLCKEDKTFSSMLQKVWDMSLKNANIHLILCGSVFSMMHSEVLSYNAPLYGRRTSNIHLKAMEFEYIKDFAPGCSNLDMMRIFASFGTIPKYLQMYEPHKSFEQNLRDNIFEKDSYLYSEGNFLLKQEISESGHYFSIMESISKGNTKLGAIASDLGIHSSYLPKYIHKLIELDIIQKEVPVTENNPTKSKMGRYRIKDKFLQFWFYYVYKNYNYLEIGQIDLVADEVAKNFNDRFVSFAFEDYVLHELMKNPRKYIDFIPKKAGRWWNNKQEIDIVAFDDEHIAFIECKWQNSVNVARVKEKLVQKATTIKTNKQKSYHVVTKNDYLQGG